MTSSKPGEGAVFLEAGSEEHTADLIRAQDRLRAADREAAIKKWTPWAVGGLVIGGGLYLLFRD